MFDVYVIGYLFLAGAGAGCFAIASCRALCAAFAGGAIPARLPSDMRFGLMAAPPLLVAASLFLLLDLGSPERAWLVFLHPLDSAIGAGACCVALLVLVATLGLWAADQGRGGVAAVCWGLGLPLSLGAMSYTGILLSSMVSVDVWRTALVPALFVLSSFSTGFATIEAIGVLVEGRVPGSRAFRRVAFACTALEALALAVFLLDRYAYSAVARLSCEALLWGGLAFPLWFGVAFLGLATPLAMRILFARLPFAGFSLAASMCALVGGFCLRYCIVNAALLPTALIGNFL